MATSVSPEGDIRSLSTEKLRELAAEIRADLSIPTLTRAERLLARTHLSRYAFAIDSELARRGEQ